MYTVYAMLFENTIMRFPKEGRSVLYSLPLPSQRMVIGAFGSMLRRTLHTAINRRQFHDIMDYYMSKLATVKVTGNNVKKKAVLGNGTLEFFDHNTPPLTKRMLYAVEITDAEKVIVFMIFKNLDNEYQELLERIGRYFKLESDEGFAYPTMVKVINTNKTVKANKSSTTINSDFVINTETNIIYDFTVDYIHTEKKKKKYEFKDTITAYPLTRRLLYSNIDVLFKDTPVYEHTPIKLKERVKSLQVKLGEEFTLNNKTPGGEFIIPLV